MTKNEKQQLETIGRYLESGSSLMESGRIHEGKESVEKAKLLVEVILSIASKKK